jgi:hypothetical protein
MVHDSGETRTQKEAAAAAAAELPDQVAAAVASLRRQAAEVWRTLAPIQQRDQLR